MTIKLATTFQDQIALLRSRGMSIADEQKAMEVLADIGYYRLGFYWVPFECGYPRKSRRDHLFSPGASFENAVALYYFDQDLRSILTKYLHRVEVHFRTTLIYKVSNYYRNNPVWFADPHIVKQDFLMKLPSLYADVRKNDAIKNHHSKYFNVIYAPAWKTLEYMTFGGILYLYENLRDENLKAAVSLEMGVRNIKVFMSYMQTLRVMRNICAHGHNIFDLRLAKSINPGAVRGLSQSQRSSVSGAMSVLAFLLDNISENRRREFVSAVRDLVDSAMATGIAPYVSHVMVVESENR